MGSFFHWYGSFIPHLKRVQKTLRQPSALIKLIIISIVPLYPLLELITTQTHTPFDWDKETDLHSYTHWIKGAMTLGSSYPQSLGL